MTMRSGDSSRPRCRCCRKFLTDETSVSRGVGPCCWEGRLSPAERAEIEASLPPRPARPARPRRLTVRRAPGIPGRRPHRDEDMQPALFDVDELEEAR